MYIRSFISLDMYYNSLQISTKNGTSRYWNKSCFSFSHLPPLFLCVKDIIRIFNFNWLNINTFLSGGKLSFRVILEYDSRKNEVLTLCLYLVNALLALTTKSVSSVSNLNDTMKAFGTHIDVRGSNILGTN